MVGGGSGRPGTRRTTPASTPTARRGGTTCAATARSCSRLTSAHRPRDGPTAAAVERRLFTPLAVDRHRRGDLPGRPLAQPDQHGAAAAPPHTRLCTAASPSLSPPPLPAAATTTPPPPPPTHRHPTRRRRSSLSPSMRARTAPGLRAIGQRRGSSTPSRPQAALQHRQPAAPALRLLRHVLLREGLAGRGVDAESASRSSILSTAWAPALVCARRRRVTMEFIIPCAWSDAHAGRAVSAAAGPALGGGGALPPYTPQYE